MPCKTSNDSRLKAHSQRNNARNIARDRLLEVVQRLPAPALLHRNTRLLKPSCSTRLPRGFRSGSAPLHAPRRGAGAGVMAMAAMACSGEASASAEPERGRVEAPQAKMPRQLRFLRRRGRPRWVASEISSSSRPSSTLLVRLLQGFERASVLSSYSLNPGPPPTKEGRRGR